VAADDLVDCVVAVAALLSRGLHVNPLWGQRRGIRFRVPLGEGSTGMAATDPHPDPIAAGSVQTREGRTQEGSSRPGVAIRPRCPRR
jgi:hypothetical protein